MAPRTNYSRVNTGAVGAADAIAAAQKSIPPRGLEMLPTSGAGAALERPRLQDMVKAAMRSSLARLDVTREALRQSGTGSEKAAASPCATCGKSADECKGHEKRAELALKLASALEYIADELSKEGASLVEPGKGPGALQVSEVRASTPLPEHHGQAHHQVPEHPGLQKGLRTEQAPTQLENTLEHPPGPRERMVLRNQGGKTASLAARIRKLASERADLEETESEGMSEAKKGLAKVERAHEREKAASLVDYYARRTKEAEDAINPAHISAGRAVPPETSAAGEKGGQPAGGAPQGPTQLVASNESSAHYTRGQAYANRKTDLRKYLTEPALTSSTDRTLQDVFANTPRAGVKISSAPEILSPRTAAARALLHKLAESVLKAPAAEGARGDA
ncbi:hypothetical protein LVJ94_34880 [Pendulispora rubella]|uniref:Uncharacterized protein n=1 Tax=Pendulispora rubella TaxID=2741070 RepID=A0ABZ2KX01_9BACT